MAQFPALPIWTDALLSDTMHLTPAEFGAYMRLLIVAWRRPNCDLPNDDNFLGRVAGDHKNWHRLKLVVMPFFTLGEDGLFRQKRLLREREYVSQRAERQRDNINSRWSKNKDLTDTTVIPNTYQTDTPIPTPIPKEESTPPIGPPRGGHPLKRKTGLPNFFPAEKDLAWSLDWWAGKGRMDLQDSLNDEIQKFRDHHTAKGTTSADWPASWRTWTQNALKFNEVKNGRGNGKQLSAHDKFFSAGLSLIREFEAGAAEGQHHSDDVVAPSRPLLPR